MSTNSPVWIHPIHVPLTLGDSDVSRIHKYATCSNECFILALIYIDRLIQRNNFLLTELNVHRVVITAVLVAAKFFDDAYYNNAYYAKVGGVLVSEMNGLEVDFLFRVNFSLQFTPELFRKYRDELLSHANVVVPSILQMVPVSIATHGGVYMGIEPDPRNHHFENRNYITPSPPAESAQAMPVNHIASDVSGLDNPYLQPAHPIPQYPSNLNCSPQAAYPRNASTDQFFSADLSVAYPFHAGVLVHQNSVKVEHGFHSHQHHVDPIFDDTKVKHGFHSHPHHLDPVFSDSNHIQYIIGGQHVLTGCSGGS